MSDQSKLGLGHIITTHQERDAIHVAVAPVVAGQTLTPGEHVGITADKAYPTGKKIGVVDPFLKRDVPPGAVFWLFLYPGSITSLRHEWAHPAFTANAPTLPKSDSEKWMRNWAERNIQYGYGYAEIDAEGKYKFALQMGHDMSVGPNESAADEVNSEWWNHWEELTGEKGQRDEYFSCGC